jgi:hypothetical protein
MLLSMIIKNFSRVVYYHPFFKIKKFDHFVLCGDTHREFPLSSEEEEEK